MTSPPAKRNAPQQGRAAAPRTRNESPQRNGGARSVKPAPRSASANDSRIAATLTTLERADRTSIVVELLRPSHDVRLVFTARDATNPKRLHRLAYVVVHHDELDTAIAALMTARARGEQRGAP